jgi:hypothetical protein
LTRSHSIHAHVRHSRSAHVRKHSVDLKRRPPKSLPTVSLAEGLLPQPRTRSARTPPSTFLFLPIQFSNSPGPVKVPYPNPSEFQKASKPPAADLGRKLCHRIISEELRRRAIAPSGGAPTRRICAGRVFLSTARFGNFRPMRDFHRRRPTGNHAPSQPTRHQRSRERGWVQCKI